MAIQTPFPLLNFGRWFMLIDWPLSGFARLNGVEWMESGQRSGDHFERHVSASVGSHERLCLVCCLTNRQGRGGQVQNQVQRRHVAAGHPDETVNAKDQFIPFPMGTNALNSSLDSKPFNHRYGTRRGENIRNVALTDGEYAAASDPHPVTQDPIAAPQKRTLVHVTLPRLPDIHTSALTGEKGGPFRRSPYER
jgi:hypothetical protein